jgi:hypothetical protein
MTAPIPPPREADMKKPREADMKKKTTKARTKKPAYRRLGSWTCPSGNTVDVYVKLDDGSMENRWEIGPPVPPDDEAYFQRKIYPYALAEWELQWGDSHQHLFPPSFMLMGGRIYKV